MRTTALCVALAALTLFSTPPAAAQERCAAPDWRSYEGTDLKRWADDAAYVFTTHHMAIDADGAPNAYHPDDVGLDALANSGWPRHSWWKDVLAVDPTDPTRPYVQPDGRFRGYFVSKTSLQDTGFPRIDHRRYVDATQVPYLVFPGSFYRAKGTGLLGDLGLAIHPATGKQTPFVVADVGPSRAKLGEVSMRLAEALGGVDVDPRNGRGAPTGPFVYVVFPYSARVHAWPLDAAELERVVEERVTELGGIAAILACR